MSIKASLYLSTVQCLNTCFQSSQMYYGIKLDNEVTK